MNASYKEVTRRVQAFLRLIILGALAGGFAGLVVGGIGGRLAMWAVAVARGDTPAVHAEPTTQMILEVTYRGIGIGILYGLSRGLFAGPTLRRAATFGAVLVLLMLVFAFATNWRTEFSESPLAVSLIAFGAVFFVYGVTAERVLATLEKVIETGRASPLSASLYSLLAVPALIAGGLGLLIILAKDLIGGR
jgi:hypothetical protein